MGPQPVLDYIRLVLEMLIEINRLTITLIGPPTTNTGPRPVPLESGYNLGKGSVERI